MQAFAFFGQSCYNKKDMEHSIEKATLKDLPSINALFMDARAFLKHSGVDQWQDGYPESTDVQADIAGGVCYVLKTGEEIVATMTVTEYDENYDQIDGAWLCGGKYFAVHRVAVKDGHRGKGLTRKLYDFALDLAKKRGAISLRADTHKDNLAMQRALTSYGFLHCGVVVISRDNTLREAYELPLKE